jgi:hypothetical protein
MQGVQPGRLLQEVLLLLLLLLVWAACAKGVCVCVRMIVRRRRYPRRGEVEGFFVVSDGSEPSIIDCPTTQSQSHNTTTMHERPLSAITTP